MLVKKLSNRGRSCPTGSLLVPDLELGLGGSSVPKEHTLLRREFANKIIKCFKSELKETGFYNLVSCITDKLQQFSSQVQ